MSYYDLDAADDATGFEQEPELPCGRCHKWAGLSENGRCTPCEREIELVEQVRERRRKQYRELRRIGYSRQWATAYVFGEPPPDDPPVFDFSPKAERARKARSAA